MRRIESTDPNPHASAISFNPLDELSIICCAASTRRRLTSCPGVILISRRHTREKCLGLIPLSQSLDGEVPSKVLKHVDLQLPQRFERCCLTGEHVAVLCLSPGTNKKHDHLPRYCQRRLVAMQLLTDQATGQNRCTLTAFTCSISLRFTDPAEKMA